MSVGPTFLNADAWSKNVPAEIPCPANGDPFFTMSTTLDGKDYIFGFQYQVREDRWYLTLMDQGGNLIVAGLKVLADWPLWRARQFNPAVPPGMLFALDKSGKGDPPGLNDLGTRVILVYYPVTPLVEQPPATP